MIHQTKWIAVVLILAGSLRGVAHSQEKDSERLRPVRVMPDLSYADTDNPRQKLDLYLPARRVKDKRWPVVVYIHGGAWRSGNKSRGRGRVMPYVATGQFAGVSIGYRLTGEAIWPAQIHDCKAAIRWLKANASTYGLDPDRIGIIGSSAGGHLVAMLGTSGGVKELAGSVGRHEKFDSRVACVVDEYGPTAYRRMNDFPGRIDHDAKNSPESLLVGGPIQERADQCRNASPLTWVTKDDPLFLIIHGTDDPLVPFNQSELLAARLKAAGVPFILQTMQNGGHGGFRSEELQKRTRAFFEKHLLGRRVEMPKTPITIQKRNGR